jgi:hypothetical protein
MNAECIITDTPTTVYHGAGDFYYLYPALNAAINRAIRQGLFAGLSGMYSVKGPPYNDEEGDTYINPDSPILNKNTAAAEEQHGLGVAGKVIIPVAAVTLFLLAILFLRRRHKETTTTKRIDAGDDSLLDYDTDEETSANRAMFVNDDDTVSTGPFDGILDEQYMTDSYLGRNQSTMDVHVCQSSLCDACENRDRGIAFIKTGAPESPERLPPNATREYSADDTVSL